MFNLLYNVSFVGVGIATVSLWSVGVVLVSFWFWFPQQSVISYGEATFDFIYTDCSSSLTCGKLFVIFFDSWFTDTRLIFISILVYLLFKVSFASFFLGKLTKIDFSRGTKNSSIRWDMCVILKSMFLNNICPAFNFWAKLGQAIHFRWFLLKESYFSYTVITVYKNSATNIWDRYNFNRSVLDYDFDRAVISHVTYSPGNLHKNAKSFPTKSFYEQCLRYVSTRKLC